MDESLMIFSAKRTSRLTEVSLNQLKYWDLTRFYRPSYPDGTPGHSSTRFYSFRDLVALRTIHRLRNERHVPLPRLRDLARDIEKKSATPWASIRFYGKGRNDVQWTDPTSGDRLAAVPPMQGVLILSTDEIVNDLGERIRGMNRRQGDIGKLTHPPRRTRRRVIQGTRIPTELIWEYHQARYTAARIIEQFPQLRKADVAAALKYERTRHRKVA